MLGESKVKAELSGQGARGDVVCPAEGGNEVIEGVLIGNIDRGQLQAHFVLVAVEEIVVTDGEVKEVARGDAVWVVIRIVGAGRGDGHQTRSVLRPRAQPVAADGRT